MLKSLADKLGTTVENLWEVLMKQAPIAAVTETVICAVFGLAVFASYRLVRKKTKRPSATDADKFPRAEWEEDAAFAGWLVTVLLVIPFLIQLREAAVTVSTVALNPEYWALHELLSN